MRLTVPIRMPSGNGDGSRSETVPAVTIRSPLRISFAFGTRSSRRSPGEPVTGRIEPGWSASAASAAAPNSASLSSITTALPSETVLTLPTSPLPLITGWLIWTPSLEPLLISIVEYHDEFDRL
jgi:hypothetical protein